LTAGAHEPNRLPACLSAGIVRQGQTLQNLLCMLPVAVARSSSDGVAMLCSSVFTDDLMLSYHATYGRTDGHGIVDVALDGRGPLQPTNGRGTVVRVSPCA